MELAPRYSFASYRISQEAGEGDRIWISCRQVLAFRATLSAYGFIFAVVVVPMVTIAQLVLASFLVLAIGTG
ncbi:MAG: hypothetical protein ACREA0_12690 [bacterium]